MHSFPMNFNVAILGATGLVGQRFVQLLEDHPWFQVTCLAASERSAGLLYGSAVNWRLEGDVPSYVSDVKVARCSVDDIDSSVSVVFSALDASVAGDVEEEFAKAGFAVFSNARNHRFDPLVPLVVPYVNSDHLNMIEYQQKEKRTKGFIVTNANCSSTGLVVPLKALDDAFGIEQVFVCTMQALSGAGYPGVASIDAMDNVIPFISGEEPKMESEPLKIMGKLSDTHEHIESASFSISAHCNRVAVIDGHTECVSVRLKSNPSIDQVKSALRDFCPSICSLGLPSCPARPLTLLEGENRPQARLDRRRDNGMTVSIGRVRHCPLLGYKFVLLSHNTILGAAGSSILNAEFVFQRNASK